MTTTTIQEDRPVLGYTLPRLFTEPKVSLLTRRTTLGYEVIEFGQRIGINVLPWQRWWLLHFLELNPDGTLRFKRALLLVSRQQGKSFLCSLLALWILSRGRTVLYSSTTIDTAKEQWEITADYAEDHPEYFGGEVKLRKPNGQYAIECPGLKCKYKIVSAGRRGGRGLSGVGLVLVDELREHMDFDALNAVESTTLSVPDALLVMLSNAGDVRSVVLNHWRAVAQSGEDPELFYAEWSAADGSEIDDVEALRQAGSLRSGVTAGHGGDEVV
ncbi:hypothetical protein [Actinoplanes derwentensis]|uniref:Phage Terminase n=1 Tax=Actinoplanes derwentensis TaxID=113562 RepID=A0A1H1V369_9ACTN|nr:hypothetical protein [Actinoplanes derwentensis]SDS78921.1 hypothetical protein SAMN04489716_1620 [Actinoplanes derwentensis]